MPIDFQSSDNMYTYTSRSADQNWSKIITSLCQVNNCRVADIGCGGGIYSRELAALGACEVIGVDFSSNMIEAAKQRSMGFKNIRFTKGNAYDTNLASHSVDVVLARALIHHLDDLGRFFGEVARILRPGGSVIIQDRVPEDIHLPGSPEHIRGYFFEVFPNLMKIETTRRPSIHKVNSELDGAGFTITGIKHFWEIRRSYQTFRELSNDIMKRTGRSILHELSDSDLIRLTEFIASRLDVSQPITERDRWTIWSASKQLVEIQF